MFFSDFYDKKYLFQCLIWLGIVFGLMRVTNGAGFAIVIPMVFYCAIAQRTEALLFWLLVAVSSIIINPYVVPKAGSFAWMQRGVMLFLGCVMSVRIMAYPLHGIMRPYAGMLFYILFMALPSALGWNPQISYLKLTLFTLIYFSYLGVSNQIGINPRVSSRKIRSVMLSMAILFIVGSVVLVPFPGLSQLRAEDFELGRIDVNNYVSLFMGMTSHSQCLGPAVSVMSVILLGDLLFSIKKLDPLYMILLCCCPYLIFLSSSRTGMGAFVLGHLFLFWTFVNAQGVGMRWRSRVLSSAMIILTALFMMFLFSPFAQDKFVKYMTKSDEVQVVSAEAVVSSRMGLMAEALYNFQRSPLIGNGFQVSREMENLKTGGLAVLSAPIEKGVWVTAVLEEGGIVGWVIFVVFIFACVVKSLRGRAYIGASCFIVFVISNLGEFSFFSMSYLGGFAWAMVFVGLALDMRKMNDENEALRRQMEFEQMQMEMQEGVL